MSAQPRKMSEILLEMAQILLRQPSEVPSSAAAHVALLFANVAWNECVGLDDSRKGYRKVFETIEADNPELWNEFNSSDINAMIDELVQYKKTHHLDDRRRILTCGIPDGKVRVEWLPAAAPGVDSRWEMGLYGLVRAGECEQAIRFLQETQGLPRKQASRQVKAIATELGLAGIGHTDSDRQVEREGVMAKKKAAKTETKSEFLRKALGRNPNVDHRQINRRWAKSGHAGEISTGLFYQVRAKMGIRTEWGWAREPEPQSRPKHAESTAEIYQFKITLLDTRPPVWRRIQVGDCTLDKLHEHIQTAMSWTNSHLHHFRINETLYGDPMLMQETFGELQYKDSTTTRLSDILPPSGERFRFEYEYDFGDSWQHEVLFEGRLQVEPGKRYPLCLEGARACPPEDVGGVVSFADFLEAIADPEHEEHDELLEWAGGKFDPEAFNPVVATRRMKRGLPDWREVR